MDAVFGLDTIRRQTEKTHFCGNGMAQGLTTVDGSSGKCLPGRTDKERGKIKIIRDSGKTYEHLRMHETLALARVFKMQPSLYTTCRDVDTVVSLPSRGMTLMRFRRASICGLAATVG